MCYSGCPYEDTSGMCRLRYPKCDQDQEDSDAQLSELADCLYDEITCGDRTEQSAKAIYQRAKRRV